MKKVLQKEVSVRNVKKQISTVVIDGSAIFYVIPSPPSNVTVEDFVISFRNYIEKRLQSSDAYLVFDRCKEYSKKGVTGVSRGAHICCVHQLTTVMPIPSQKIILTIPDNKRQHISLIVENLCNNTVYSQRLKILEGW